MLTSIHTIWARNHNYWVDTLKAQTNGAWTEAEYFEAARMMNIAEYQRVVFTEFATAMAGGLDNDDEHGFDGLRPDGGCVDLGRVCPGGLPLRPLDAERDRQLC